MAEQPLRVGVTGLGKMGLLHAAVVSGAGISKLAAVADPSDVMLGVFRQHRPDVAVYKDHDEMLGSESLEAVFITAPSFLHVPMCLRCIERGVPFFVEKPLATNSAEARALVDALKKKPLTNGVGYMGRYQETFLKAKEALAAKALGKLINLRATMYVSQLFRRGKGWRYDRKMSGGGVLITQNSHLVDLLLWYFGPVEWVSGQTRSWYSDGVEDFAHGYLRFASGLSGFLDTSWSVRHHRTVDICIEVEGENGTLTVTDDTVKLFLDDGAAGLPAGWRIWRLPDLFTGVEFDVGGPAYTREDLAFLDAVKSRQMLECDVRSACRVQEVLDALYESAAQRGAPVAIEGRT